MRELPELDIVILTPMYEPDILFQLLTCKVLELI